MKLLTLNCRGLTKQYKRKHIFDECKKYSLSCLQETYITEPLAQLWKSEWKGDFYYIPGVGYNSQGLIILVNNSFKCKVNDVIKFNTRCLGLSFTHNNTSFLLYNMYAPSIKEQRIPYLNNLPNLRDYGPPNSRLIIT